MLTLNPWAKYYKSFNPKSSYIELQKELEAYVRLLSEEIGERNCYKPEALERAAKWIEKEFQKFGYSVSRQEFKVNHNNFFATAANIIAEKKGVEEGSEVLIVAAHYDSKVATSKWNKHSPAKPERPGTPGANDNASGIAALLAVAKLLADKKVKKTVRFVAFANEEPPFFRNQEAMGSSIFARSCREIKNSISGAIIFDCLGCFKKSNNSKRKKFWFLPSLLGLPEESNYIAFLSNLSSAKFMNRSAFSFVKYSEIDLRVVAVPCLINRIAWSDDWSFWQEGIPAFTITDTAYLRSYDYHELSDTYDKLDYVEFAQLTWSIYKLLEELVS